MWVIDVRKMMSKQLFDPEFHFHALQCSVSVNRECHQLGVVRVLGFPWKVDQKSAEVAFDFVANCVGSIILL